MEQAFGAGKQASVNLDGKYTADYRKVVQVRDPINALTHFIGCVMAVVSMPFLIIQAASHISDRVSLFSVSIFMLSMVFLYGASTAYHTFTPLTEKGNVLKKLDHCMIFVLIAGSYTPYCVMVLREGMGVLLMALVWGITLVGILFKLCWVTCPRWVSSVIYIGMGWLCMLAVSDIYHGLPLSSFLWLLIGGIAYTLGGVIYALKFVPFRRILPGFGAHELFHLFVLIGSFCHFISVFLLVSVF